jgi:hypothetical protein
MSMVLRSYAATNTAYTFGGVTESRAQHSDKAALNAYVAPKQKKKAPRRRARSL